MRLPVSVATGAVIGVTSKPLTTISQLSPRLRLANLPSNRMSWPGSSSAVASAVLAHLAHDQEKTGTRRATRGVAHLHALFTHTPDDRTAGDAPHAPSLLPA